MEKYRDGQRELHCVFVDLEKAYDRVPRDELWYCMRKSGVAEKFVRVVQDMYDRSRTVVRCAVGQTEEFNVEVGLHQGSALSPFLFAIVMDQLSEEVRQESPWTMMFADDIVICSESREQVEENLERWRFALERRGMKVSRNESKFEVLFGKLGRHVIWTKEDKDNPSCYQRSVQKPASLMVWGCMSACGMGSLHIWKGTINAEREAATNGDSISLEEYTTSVTSYIGKCIDDVTVSKTITTRSNQKPWMTPEVCALLKSRDSAFRAGDKEALRTERAKLSRAIKETKRTHAQRIHGHFQDSGDSRRMWQGIQAITNYKTTPSACDSDASLPDALNDFYAWFEAQNNVAARKTIPPPDD
ncbi:hypothetical protein QTP70_001495 [Hemibagrus guttatus]|uniref:ribonuclease H n=1 Tax=Hemibagrus guttatus TaxID=175788 RepID=A0AAE0QD12_9TELE|nr:hypothetical protein QTP70_001495 [Hemibagrus guttatus]KAK3546920.1 hypothetical protein QTP86_003792 [Hemibagrus guttatus]